MKFEWEELKKLISGPRGSTVYRAKVHGGWIVNTYSWDQELKSTTESMVFVPDAQHEWSIDE